jgi:hypothetical protein
MTSGAPQPRRRGRLGCFSALALVILMPVAVQVLLTPWALHVGGRSTPFGQWTGFGRVEASNGGKYILFTDLSAGMLAGGSPGRFASTSGHGHTDTLSGTATLCTESGATHTFELTGWVDAWSSTDGAPTRIGLTHGTPEKLPSGWDVAWHGAWHGPALDLENPDNSFTEVFTPKGAIRHTTSTADAGTARVTIEYGSRDDFDTACRALRVQ